jgi:hypothetical protein
MLALKRRNVVITLEIDGRDNELALPRHVQRHLLKGNVEHVGLLLVLRDEKVVVAVQIVVVGDSVPETLVNIENPLLLSRPRRPTVRAALGTGDFHRCGSASVVRVAGWIPRVFVLEPFSWGATGRPSAARGSGGDAVEALVVDGLAYAQDHYKA